MQNSIQKQKSWWSGLSTPGGLGRRAQQIQKYRSPHTMADEMLIILKWFIQPLLIIYCMVLSFASYQAFFSHNFDANVAMLGAVALCLLVEFGKYKCGSYVFQKPFLQGWSFFSESFADCALWVGAAIFMVATFWMSVVNSTSGAHSLSVMKGTQAHAVAFTANTADIDAQIEAANARIKQNGTVKWKGVVTYQAQQAIARDSKTLEGLTRQKEALTTGQRADFERNQSNNDQYTAKGADILMAAGGWVEFLQFISLFLIAACMSVVGSIMDDETGKKPIGFAPNTNQSSQAPVNNSGSAPLFMFNRNPDGSVRSAAGNPTVSQSPQAVSQQPQAFSVMGCDAVLQQCEKKIRSDLPNFNRGDVNKETVAKRIKKALDECFDIIQKPDFAPTRSVVIAFYGFIADTTVPTLNQRGWGYERDTQFMKRLLEVIPQA